MNACYSDEATFSDPIFSGLTARETKAMWEMLCSSAKDFSLTYEIADAGESHAVVNWIARYSFGPTDRQVENKVSTQMEIKAGKIIRQADSFSFPRWARQALGPVGLILGALPFFKRKVQSNAHARLTKYLKTFGQS
jgi:hypothetical protein